MILLVSPWRREVLTVDEFVDKNLPIFFPTVMFLFATYKSVVRAWAGSTHARVERSLLDTQWQASVHTLRHAADFNGEMSYVAT